MSKDDNLNDHVLEVGEEVTCKIMKLDDKQAIVDVGSKYDGIIPISELSHLHIEHTSEILSEGEEVSAIITKIEDDAIVLSKVAKDRKVAWDQLVSYFENETVFEAKVTDVVGVGLIVDVGLRGFIPASHVETHYVEDLSEYKGKTISVKVIEVDERRNRVILSHRSVVESEQSVQKANLLQNLEAGQEIEGVVRRIASFGVFVDIGGIDGLIHISQLSHQHIASAEEVVELSQKITVKIITVDRDTERIGLSLKEMIPGPWENVDSKLQYGQIIEGTVKRIVNFGAFVEVLPQVEGLVHISQISTEHIGNPNEALHVGQKVKVKVLEVNEKQRRIALSIKEVEKAEENAEVEKYQKEHEESAFQLGDLIGDKLKGYRNK
ncbi:30S ribosomal protein S1 [Halalkalibacillus halophilus]|uniref:30S ribosomal protein S1 n=1 Tax=Halalkalibacillus halophilus TaxID=392827 RepID=UPI000417D50E|nr:30S ribosomal protein S1 [Halalkalibacillus halophilus]